MKTNNLFMLDPLFKKFRVGKSHIHGLGLFSQRKFEIGSFLGLALIQKNAASKENIIHLISGYGDNENDPWFRVIGAQFINHSKNPNIEFRYENDTVQAYALLEINEGEEITGNYVPIFNQINLTIPEFAQA